MRSTATIPPAWRCKKWSRGCPGQQFGIISACSITCLQASGSWTRSRLTKQMFCQSDSCQLISEANYCQLSVDRRLLIATDNSSLRSSTDNRPERRARMSTATPIQPSAFRHVNYVWDDAYANGLDP